MSNEPKNSGRQPQGPMGRGGFGGGPMGGRPVQKAKDVSGTIKRMMVYLRPYAARLYTVLIFAVLSTVFSIVGPKILGKATTRLQDGVVGKVVAYIRHTPTPQIDFKYIGGILLLMLGLYIVSSIFSLIMQYMMAGVAQKTVFDMRHDVHEKLSRLPLKFFDGRTHGEIMSRVANDIDTISTTLQQSLTQLITSVCTIIGVLIMMLTISPLLTFITIIVLPISSILTVAIAKQSQKHFAAQQRELGQLNSHVEEMFTGHKVVKVFRHEQQSIETMRAINDRLYHVGWKAQFISGVIFPLMGFLNNIGYVLVCVMGGIYVTKGYIKLGDVQAFIQYSRSFTMPISQTANIINILQSTIASAERVFEILDEPEELADPEEAAVISAPRGEVCFHDVKFGYKEGALLMEDLNLQVHPGQMVAIVGPTGAGKTTLINLLMRFYEINGGKITVDGVDIRDLKRGDLRRMFGMVLQDTWLFSGTIKENIAYGKAGATEAEIIQAAKAAHADHFIRALPHGYDTVINEEASNISQGEKQLLTIARAILADPTVLILDEATSSVDTRTEVYIQRAMQALMKDRTSFVIAHRLSTIRDAEIILVMKQGQIIEMGNHKELIAKGGFYADLYNSQFNNADLVEEAS